MKELIGKLEIWGCDVKETLNRFLGDDEMYANFVIKYKDTLRIEELDKLINENKAKEAFEVAHDIKGVTGNLGLTPIYEIICRIVEPLRAGRTDGLGELLEELKIKKAELDKLTE